MFFEFLDVCCRIFSGSDMTVLKWISPWQLMEVMVGVKFADIKQLYHETSEAPGLVHAVLGPNLVHDVYMVTLAPIGRRGEYELLRTEEDVQRMAHGLLHGLNAIHQVSW